MSPVVPRYEGPQVRRAPLPVPRVPSGAFTPPPPVDVSGVQKVVVDLYERHRAAAIQVKRVDYRSRLANVRTRIVSNALAKRGRDALGLPEEARDEWRRELSEANTAYGGVPLEEQAILEAIAADYWQDIDATVQRHIAREFEAFDTERTESLIRGEVDFGLQNFTDFARGQRTVETLRAAYAEHARRGGKSPEWLQERTGREISQFRAGVINRLVTVGRPDAATEYLQTHKAELVGDDLLGAEKVVRAGTLLGKVQRNADEIMRTPEITRADAFERARSIEDPIERRETQQELDVEFRRRDAAEQEQEAILFERAAEFVERGQSPPAVVLARLKPSQQSSLERRRRQVAGGERQATNWETWYGLTRMAAQNQEDFLAENLLEYRSDLSDTDFKQLAGLQRRMRDGDDGDDVRGFLTDEEIVNGVLEESQMFKGAKSGSNTMRRLIRFRRLVDRRLVSEKRNSGKKVLSPKTVEEIVNQMLLRMATMPWILEE